MIYGEETAVLQFDNGLFETDSPEKTPEGFCSTFQNVLIDDQKSIIPRPAFILCSQATAVSQAYPTLSSTFKPAYYGDFRFRKLGGYGTNNPDGWLNTEAKLTNYKKNLSTDATNSATTITGGHTFDWSTACMFRDRIYAYCSTDNQIKRLTGWSFTGASALTETTCGTTPGSSTTPIAGMFFFKSRLFCWGSGTTANRIMFTDEITAGTYPETWNTGTNFFDLPSDGSPTIHNIFVIDNTLWVMSEDGIYTVLVYGTPSNWIVRKVNERIITTSKYDSCISADNIIFFKTNESVFAYNREKIVEIGTPIKKLFQRRGTVALVSAIFSDEKGIYLSLQKLGASGGNYTLEGASTYYFNGNGWSKIVYGSNTFLSVSQAFSARDILALSNWSSSRCTYISLLYGTAAGSLTSGFFYVAEGNYTENISCLFEIPVRESWKNEKRFKYGFIDLYSRLTTLYRSITSQGQTMAEATYTLASSADNNNLVKFSMPQTLRRIKIKFRIEITAAAAIVGTAPFQIKNIGALVNVGRTEPDATSG